MAVTDNYVGKAGKAACVNGVCFIWNVLLYKYSIQVLRNWDTIGSLLKSCFLFAGSYCIEFSADKTHGHKSMSRLTLIQQNND